MAFLVCHLKTAIATISLHKSGRVRWVFLVFSMFTEASERTVFVSKLCYHYLECLQVRSLGGGGAARHRGNQ